MRFELPYCRRCCLCVPLRHGILIYGYLNLLFSVLIIVKQIWIDIYHAHETYTFLYRGVEIPSQTWFYYILMVPEVVFNIVLLVGAYKKDARLIRAYYYFGIMTTAAAFLTFFISRPLSKLHYEYYETLMICICISGIVLECYLLLLIRTWLKKQQFQGGHQFRYLNREPHVVVESLAPEDSGNPF